MGNVAFLIAVPILLILILTLTIYLAVLLRPLLTEKENASAKFDEVYLKIRDDIKFAVAPNFINLSPSTDDFVQFAIETWRLKQRVAKIESQLPEGHKKGLENSVEKLNRYFEKYDIEVVDYTDKKFNEGLNLDVLSVENDPTVTEPKVKETVEPTVMYRGQVIRKAKIIVATNQS